MIGKGSDLRHDLIAAVALGGVKKLVGLMKNVQRAEGSFAFCCGYADANGGLDQFGIEKKRGLGNGFTEPFRNVDRLFRVCFHQHHREFFAAVPGKEVFAANAVSNAFAEFPEYKIPTKMAVFIVD